MLDTVVFVDSQAIDYFLNDVVLVKINAEVDSLLAQKFSVRGYPTAVLLGADGEEIDRLVGFDSTEIYLQTIRDYLQGIGTLEDLLARSETEEDRELFFEIANKYKYSGRTDDAVVWFGKVIDSGDPTDSLSSEARFSIADTYRREDDYETALHEFMALERDFAGGELESTAVIYQAIILRDKGDTTRAIARFEDYMKRFPEGDAVSYAEGQIEKLKNPDNKEE